MKKVGQHVTIDFLGVKKDYTPEFYEKIIYTIAKAAKVEILNVSSHRFQPQGFTLVALLAESHFSFHTFPEKGVISFDFFTCGKVNPKVALKILRKEIQHERVVTNAFELAQEVENICHQYINALRIGIPKILSKKEMKIVLGKMKNYKKG